MNIQMNAASSTMSELQKKIDIISNNVANVNTTGYKKQQANFADALLHTVTKQAGAGEAGRSTPPGLRVGGDSDYRLLFPITPSGLLGQCSIEPFQQLDWHN